MVRLTRFARIGTSIAKGTWDLLLRPQLWGQVYEDFGEARVAHPTVGGREGYEIVETDHGPRLLPKGEVTSVTIYEKKRAQNIRNFARLAEAVTIMGQLSGGYVSYALFQAGSYGLAAAVGGIVVLARPVLSFSARVIGEQVEQNVMQREEHLFQAQAHQYRLTDGSPNGVDE